MGQYQDTIAHFLTAKTTATITRPANTTAYTAGDVISNVTTDAHFEFLDAVLPGHKNLGLSGAIATAICHSSANVSTKLDAELWLYQTDIGEVADNAAFAPTDAEQLTLIGIIDFPVADWKAGLSGSGAAGNATCIVTNLGLAFRAGNALNNNSIYGQLVARNGYVPVSGEILTVDLIISQD